MRTPFVHVGFGNFLAADHIVGIASPGSAPVKRMVQEGRAEGIVIDMTSGHRTKAVAFMDNGSIVLLAITSESLESRIEAARSGSPEAGGVYR